MKPLQPWQKKWQCAKCLDIIYSRYNGEFRSCACGAIAVDQTPWYSRFIGDGKDFIDVDKKNENISNK